MTNELLDNIKIQFEQFLTLIGQVLSFEKEISTVQNRLRRHFNVTSSNFLCSDEFQTLFARIHQSFKDNDKSTKFFTLLASIDDSLKKHNIKSMKSRPTKSTQSENVNDDGLPEISHVESVAVYPKDEERKRQRRITKLEKRLSRLANIIDKLEQKDMSLDEMEYCDLYVVESNFKRRACQVYQKLVELKSEDLSTERILYQPIVISATDIGHPSIAKALENFVNQNKYFPSFDEVLDRVEKTNEEKNLQMSPEKCRKVAEKSFKVIGKKIKDRRMSDFNDIMNTRLPENFDLEKDDPALESVDIQSALNENERQAFIKTEQIFEEFCKLDPQSEEEVVIETSDSSSDEDDIVDFHSTTSSPKNSPTPVSSSTIDAEPVQTLTPRRRCQQNDEHQTTNNETNHLYQLYQERLTNSLSLKRSPSSILESEIVYHSNSNIKRRNITDDEQDLVVLD